MARSERSRLKRILMLDAHGQSPQFRSPFAEPRETVPRDRSLRGKQRRKARKAEQRGGRQ